jgi:putative hydrolase of the HAD superfamily
VTWILFDYAGVISHPQPTRVAATMAALLGAGPAEFDNAYWADRAAYDMATIDAATYWQGVAGRMLTEETVEQLVEIDIDGWLHMNTDTLALIEELSTRRDLALLSNAPVELARAVDEQPWAELFRHRFYSADLGRAKPDPRVYEDVCRLLDAEPSDIRFIDDRAENVAAAAQLGLDAILFTSADELRAQV